MTFGRFSPKNGLLAFFSTVGREFFPFFLAPRDFSPVLYRCFILLYRRKTVWKGIKNIRFFAPIKKKTSRIEPEDPFLCAGQRHNYPIFYGNVSVCTQTSENTSATTKRAAFSRTSSYVTPTYFLAAFVKNKQFAKRAASANGAYNTVRKRAKTQARQ